MWPFAILWPRRCSLDKRAFPNLHSAAATSSRAVHTFLRVYPMKKQLALITPRELMASTRRETPRTFRTLLSLFRLSHLCSVVFYRVQHIVDLLSILPNSFAAGFVFATVKAQSNPSLLVDNLLLVSISRNGIPLGTNGDASETIVKLPAVGIV